jgi:RNA polymerase sigma-70 factor (ECF subfamily)
MQETHSEEKLIEAARQGKRRAVHTLYERHAPHVLSVVYRIVGDEELARDCAQETWMRAIRALPSFRGEARLSTWLHRVAVNTAIQARRREGRHAVSEVTFSEEIAQPNGSGDVLLAQNLRRALAGIPDRMREVLILHDVDGYTHEQIGEILGVAAGTSKSQLFKARARMRELLSGIGLSEYVANQREGVQA